MKKQLTLALGLTVLATPAFATKARLEAFGEDNYGSYFINDNRNQFLNPAQINNHKDLVTYEFGSSSDGTKVTADSPAAPKAEGGVNKAIGNMVYGLHFGNSTPLASTTRALGGDNLAERNPIDLFIGGDAGIKWGAGVTYEQFDGGSAANRLASNSLRLKGGVIAGDTQAFAQVSLKGDAKDFQGGSVEGKSSFFLGASHAMNGNTFFADYKMIGADYKDASAKESWDFTEARLGAGRVERLNDKANLFAKLSLERRTIEDDGASSFTTAGELTRYLVPLNIGIETEATSWLSLRASVGQYLWSNQEVDPKAGSKTSKSLANTAVRAGATLKFGELSIDGLISTNGSGDGTNNSTDASTDAGNGTLRTDNLMTRVAMTYRF